MNYVSNVTMWTTVDFMLLKNHCTRPLLVSAWVVVFHLAWLIYCWIISWRQNNKLPWARNSEKTNTLKRLHKTREQRGQKFLYKLVAIKVQVILKAEEEKRKKMKKPLYNF